MCKNTMLRRIMFAATALMGGLVAPDVFAQQSSATWSKAAPLPIARNEFPAVTVGDKIYVIGGAWTETKDGKSVDRLTDGFMTEYDPKTNQWRERARAPEGLSHQGAVVVNGKIYVAGGFAGGRHTLPSAGVYVYDPAIDRWQTLAPLSSPRGAVALASVGGLIYAVGGRQTESEGALTTHEVYNPVSNSWRKAAPLPSARDHVGIFVVDRKIHVIGGRTSDSFSNVGTHEVYDPGNDKWFSAPPMPTPRSSVAFAEYRGLLFVAGGECVKDGERLLSNTEVEAYEPKANRWLKFPALPTPLHGFAAATAADKLFFFAGSVPCGGGGKVADTHQLTLP